MAELIGLRNQYPAVNLFGYSSISGGSGTSSSSVSSSLTTSSGTLNVSSIVAAKATFTYGLFEEVDINGGTIDETTIGFEGHSESKFNSIQIREAATVVDRPDISMLNLSGLYPEISLQCLTQSFANSANESIIRFKDFNNNTLAAISASHEGANADSKGKIIFKVNNGTTLTDAITINSQGEIAAQTVTYDYDTFKSTSTNILSNNTFSLTNTIDDLVQQKKYPGILYARDDGHLYHINQEYYIDRIAFNDYQLHDYNTQFISMDNNELLHMYHPIKIDNTLTTNNCITTTLSVNNYSFSVQDDNQFNFDNIHQGNNQIILSDITQLDEYIYSHKNISINKSSNIHTLDINGTTNMNSLYIDNIEILKKYDDNKPFFPTLENELYVSSELSYLSLENDILNIYHDLNTQNISSKNISSTQLTIGNNIIKSNDDDQLNINFINELSNNISNELFTLNGYNTSIHTYYPLSINTNSNDFVLNCDGFDSKIFKFSYNNQYNSLIIGTNTDYNSSNNFNFNLINNSIFSIKNTNSSILTIDTNQKFIGIQNTSPNFSLDFSTTDGIKIPSGNTSQRPNYNNQTLLGTIRFNSETNHFEGFGKNNTWNILSGVTNSTSTTYIDTDNSNNILFYTNSNQRAILNSSGLFGINTNNPQNLLHLESTNTQFRIAYDNTKYTTFTHDSNNILNITNSSNGKINYINSSTSAPILTIDTQNTRVGFKTSSPAADVHIIGTLKLEGDFQISGSFQQIDTNVNTTEQWTVVNNGTNIAVTVVQQGTKNLLELYDADGLTTTNAQGTLSSTASDKITLSSTTDYNNIKLYGKITVNGVSRFVKSKDGNNVITLNINASFGNNQNFTYNNPRLGMIVTDDCLTGFNIDEPTTGRVEIQDTSLPQLVLSNNTNQTKFTVDTNNNLTINPSSTGSIILKPTTNSTDFLKIQQQNASDIFVIDSTTPKIICISPLHINTKILNNGNTNNFIDFNNDNFDFNLTSSKFKISSSSIETQNNLLYLDLNNNRIGIKNNNPSELLHIYDTQNYNIKLDGTANSSISFSKNNTNLFSFGLDNDKLKIGTTTQISQTPILSVLSSGFIGFNIETPTSQCEIRSNQNQLKLSFNDTNYLEFSSVNSYQTIVSSHRLSLSTPQLDFNINNTLISKYDSSGLYFYSDITLNEKIIHNENTSTYLQFDTDIINLKTTNSHLKIDSTNSSISSNVKFGIGTTNPSELLTLNNTNGSIIKLEQNNSLINWNDIYKLKNETNDLILQKSNSTILTISNNKFGFNTLSPTRYVDITDNSNPQLRLRRSNTIFVDFLVDADNNLSFIKPDGTTIGVQGNGQGGGGSTDDNINDNNSNILFYADKTNSRIGIKTNSPAYELDVIGNASVKDTLYITNSNNNKIGIQNPSNSNNQTYILPNSYTGGNFLRIDNNGQLSWEEVVVDNSNSNINIEDGKFGIGTTNPKYSIHIERDDSMKIPSGGVGGRTMDDGIPVGGNIRFNSQLMRYEGFDGQEWINMGFNEIGIERLFGNHISRKIHILWNETTGNTPINLSIDGTDSNEYIIIEPLTAYQFELWVSGFNSTTKHITYIRYLGYILSSSNSQSIDYHTELITQDDTNMIPTLSLTTFNGKNIFNIAGSAINGNHLKWTAKIDIMKVKCCKNKNSIYSIDSNIVDTSFTIGEHIYKGFGTGTQTLYLDGSSTKLIIPKKKTYYYELFAIGKTDSTTNKVAVFRYRGSIHRDNDAPLLNVSNDFENMGTITNANLTLSIENSNNNYYLNITGTGHSTAQTRWICWIKTFHSVYSNNTIHTYNANSTVNTWLMHNTYLIKNNNSGTVSLYQNNTSTMIEIDELSNYHGHVNIVATQNIDDNSQYGNTFEYNFIIIKEDDNSPVPLFKVIDEEFLTEKSKTDWDIEFEIISSGGKYYMNIKGTGDNLLTKWMGFVQLWKLKYDIL